MLEGRGIDKDTVEEPIHENQDNSEETASHEDKQYQRIGGWLIAVGIGMIIGIISDIFNVIKLSKKAFINNDWIEQAAATRPRILTYVLVYYAFSFAALLFMLGFRGYVMKLFAERKAQFPKMYIVMVILGLAFLTLDYTAVRMLLNGDNTLPDIPGLPGMIIWVVYILSSKRVKKTFVN